MEITPESLAEKFRLYSDEELLELYRSGDLTELAQTVARAELASRGIDAAGAAVPSAPRPGAEPERVFEGDLVMVARMYNPPFWPPAPMLNQLKLLVNSLRQRTISCRICCNPMPSVINDLQGVSAVPRDMRATCAGRPMRSRRRPMPVPHGPGNAPRRALGASRADGRSATCAAQRDLVAKIGQKGPRLLEVRMGMGMHPGAFGTHREYMEPNIREHANKSPEPLGGRG